MQGIGRQLIDAQKERLATVFDAPIVDPPTRWQMKIFTAVGTCFGLGFLNSDEIILVSGQGQSVVNLDKGEIVYRDHENNGFDFNNLSAVRTDKPTERCSVVGMYGGALRNSSVDGWTVNSLPAYYPLYANLLSEPYISYRYHQEHGEPAIHKLAESLDWHMFGFSPNQEYLILVDSSNLKVWGE